ncbi:MAG: GNAT family N-acetyltransferase [Proteobacteria bacterium]|nr:GNAT family N-acetyltransferase [Pseudomonadota bacterium]
MNIRFCFDTNGVNWIELAEVIKRAPLGIRDPEKQRRACENSYAVCFAFDNEKLVGMVRAVSDGEYQAAIYDMVVLPEYQGKGIGKMLMDNIEKRLPVSTSILFAAPGKESFYQKCGYRKLLTGMGSFDNPDRWRIDGYIE